MDVRLKAYNQGLMQIFMTIVADMASISPRNKQKQLILGFFMVWVRINLAESH